MLLVALKLGDTGLGESGLGSGMRSSGTSYRRMRPSLPPTQTRSPAASTLRTLAPLDELTPEGESCCPPATSVLSLSESELDVGSGGELSAPRLVGELGRDPDGDEVGTAGERRVTSWYGTRPIGPEVLIVDWLG